MTPTENSRRLLLTGAGRGLGLEFTRQWLSAGHRVFALARKPTDSSELMKLKEANPESLSVVPCDVGVDSSVENARQAVAKETDTLDGVLNNAGTYGPREDDFNSVELDAIRKVFEVNTLGPLRISRAFLPLLRKGHRPRLVHLTSLMGSISDNSSGGSYAYRISKTALNMLNRNMALDLKPSGVLTAVLHPGWVRTDMGGAGAPLAVDEAVASLVRTFDWLTMHQTGGFFDRDGNPVAW